MTVPLALYGCSGHAKVVLDAIRLQQNYEVVAVLDDRAPGTRALEFSGVPIIGGREALAGLAKLGVHHVMLAFGDCEARLALANLVRCVGLQCAVVMHPRAVVAGDVQLGSGTFVAAAAVINTESTIGENVIVNTSASIDHDCAVGDGVHICPGVHLAGRVTVGRGAWIGIGSTVRDGVVIGAGAFVGAGSVVLRDIPDQVVAYGVPARVVRNR